MSQYRIIITIFFFTFTNFFSCLKSQPFDYPTANLSTTWINSVSTSPDGRSVSFRNNSTVRAILLRGVIGPNYACGFYCNGNCETYLFAIFIVQVNSGGGIVMPSIGFPQVVWSANRNHPVRINATLQLTPQGDLVLRDADGTLAWSTNTAGKSVVGLNMTETGNLVLFDGKNNSVVWQSFDHPTDALVPGQKIVSGHDQINLTASVSSTNWSSEGGLYSLSMTQGGLVASMQSSSNPPAPRVYYQKMFTTSNNSSTYARFENGSLALYQGNSNNGNHDITRIPIPRATSAQYMRLGPDGHLRVFEWETVGTTWTEVADILGPHL